ncbi:Ran GAP Rna1 [Elasticomyces elasticus]|uniref:Ran GAP Rna1 n=1 Tax=Exophiala sideris TaxID=1016849 RepID=A0ABR0J4Q3_9EURO|nr:Ran GAP Rna1 [Elasticomyces elasticus]KAK5027407.1 Ran GAP Rna1 [Exophiala sideris]KAK5034891.1 Ran GAP Rna1 [Exophiala sideris]KAK5056375.1 Ran GAP Rna1 [Exophiala sideris]KAK5181136.1 Ran GAP Rna1 [Eurotiomycetes sp. CCFEE 6388]
MAGETFSLAGKGLKLDTKEDLEKHIQPLAESSNVTHIDLSGNTLGVAACAALAPILSSKRTLQSADLHDIFTSRLLEEIPPALSSLLTALLECPNLHTIDLSDNAFGLKTKDPLVDFLSKHVPLKHLILNNNGMGPIAGTSIADALITLAERKAVARKDGKDVPDLESIVCGRNRLENGSMPAWAKAYEAHKSGIKSVKMTQNGIRSEGISHLISSGLSHCPSLEVLDMQDNTFTFQGARALAKALEGWSGLKELGVGDDLLGGRGAIKVFEALGEGNNEKIEILRLQYNDINPAGVKALLQAAKDALPKLRRVELNGNKFEEEDPSIESLAELLSERKDEAGKDEDPDDHWGLDELDELEGEDSDEEDEGEEEEEEEEQEEAREKLVKEADEAEDQPVTQKKDAEVDDLASKLEKTL